MKQPKDLSFWKLWNLSFGFFGVQIAYALQSSQVSRIFSTIGADPHDLSYFWILPPLMGLIVQPIVGSASDRTWNRFGRRLPYLLLGAAVAIIVMCFLPNAGSLGLGVSSAIIFGLVMLMLLDTSINMAMQPFKMLVGDCVNEKQKGLAYSIQSFLCNAGSVAGYLAPFILALFLSSTAPKGEVPPTVTWAFYIGAFILLLCVVYTFAKVREMPPAEYAEYHGGAVEKDAKRENMFKLLVHAPKVFWTVGLVQFFCWAAFLYMWTYSTDAVAMQAFDAPAVREVKGIVIDGQSYDAKYIFAGQTPVLAEGHLTIAGIEIDGNFSNPSTVVLDGDTLVAGGKVCVGEQGDKIDVAGEGFIAGEAATLVVDGTPMRVERSAVAVSNLSRIGSETELTAANIAVLNDGTGEYVLEQTSTLPAVNSPGEIELTYKTVLNPASSRYQAAGDWNGVLLAIQGVAAVLWAIVLGGVRRRKPAYSLSLLLGAAGFISVMFVHNQYVLFVSYALMGCAWAAMLSMPFTILTNALSGGNIGTYLGLFNCTITIPQIVAALCGGLILGLFPATASGAANTVMMLMVSGILLVLGALAVWIVRETYGSQAGKKDADEKALAESQLDAVADI